MSLWLTPFAFRTTWGIENIRNSFSDISEFLAFTFGGSFAELGDFGHHETTLSLGEVCFLQIVEVRWNDVFFFVEEAAAGCFLRSFVDVSDKFGNPCLRLTIRFFVGLMRG